MEVEDINLTPKQAIESLFNGDTVVDDDFGYYYRLPTQEEIMYFCEPDEVIRSCKCDTTTIKLSELEQYESFMGVKTTFKVVNNR
ncbi:MAG: hypothetical protein ACPGUI_00485 [Halarcobacter sp.]